MCQTFWFPKKEGEKYDHCVMSIGELKQLVPDITEVISAEWLGDVLDRKEYAADLIDDQCLCSIDPLQVSRVLDMQVLADFNLAEYTFQKRK